MNSTASMNRSFTMIENMGGYLKIYSNVFLGTNGGGNANGMRISLGISGFSVFIYNNTFVAKSGPNNIFNITNAGDYSVRNNIVFSARSDTTMVRFVGTGSFSHDHNAWYGGSLYGGTSCNNFVSGSEASTCSIDPEFEDYNNDVCKFAFLNNHRL